MLAVGQRWSGIFHVYTDVVPMIQVGEGLYNGYNSLTMTCIKISINDAFIAI